MERRRHAWALKGLCLALLTSCGDDDSSVTDQVGGIGAQSGAAATQAGQGGSGNGGAGSHTVGGTGSAGGGSSAGAGQPSSDCSGTFGPGELALTGDPDVLLASPTLSPDAMELIYTRIKDGQIGFRRSRRMNILQPFPAGSPITSLDAACSVSEARSADLSADGKRAYVVCYSSSASPLGAGTLHVADRSDDGDTFAFRPETLQVGPSAAISADDLTLFTSSEQDAGAEPARQFTRPSQSEQFGAAQAIPGLETENLSAPDVSRDGLILFAGLRGDLVVASRTSRDKPFSAPTILFAAPSVTQPLGSPEISADCRSLVYLAQTSQNGLSTSQLMLARR